MIVVIGGISVSAGNCDGSMINFSSGGVEDIFISGGTHGIFMGMLLS